MTAVFREAYGTSESLQIGERVKPSLSDDELLIEVYASSVNPADRYIMRGLPWLVRLAEGIRRPRHLILGRDYAGVVRAVGKNIKRFSVGDEVYGDTTETWANFVSTKESRVFNKPKNMSFTEAATVPLAGVTALQAIKLVPTVKGKRVLIIGAAGGVGIFAVQIAAALGAQVVAVCSDRNANAVKSLGATQVESYENPQLAQLIAPCDVIIDMVCTQSFRQILSWMNQDASLIVVGAPMNMKHLPVRIFGPIGQYLKLMLAKKHGRHVKILMAKSNDGIEELSTMIEQNEIKAVISKVFCLSQAKEALRYLDTHRPLGKIAIEITQNNTGALGRT